MYYEGGDFMGVSDFCQICMNGTVTVIQIGLPPLVLDVSNLCYSVAEVNGEVTVDIANSPLILFLMSQGFDVAAEIGALLPPFNRPCPSDFVLQVAFIAGTDVFQLDLSLTIA
jgi:hypothetical protein